VILVVSPHLDDAVFSCGQLLAAQPGSLVVTVLGGVPSPDQSLTEWDAECGFSSSAEAVRSRLEEDTRACAMVGATPLRLGLLDGQYPRPSDHQGRLRDDLTRAITEHASLPIYVPLGIRHPDHILVGTIAREIASSLGIALVVYEELPYRVEEPEEHLLARSRILAAGWILEPRVELLAPMATKSSAVDCYVSQEGQFPREHLLAAEQYFTATRREC
jgi:LmbE family N-acetylglucosaminyl deacetylase